MLFNSYNYALFLPLVFLFYWFVFGRNLKSQNVFLLAVSYFFYGSWDYRFLFLLAFSTFLDYYTGIRIHRSQSQAMRKTWLIISVGVNLGFLMFFKYYNFFAEQAVAFLAAFGLKTSLWSLQIILPVGISFYTFHGLSYVFDIYNRKITPTENVVDYSLFVAFFPLLVAGPIERATHLLPQMKQHRTFQYTQAVEGMRQILWGLFKKIVIADNCAIEVNKIFGNYEQMSGSTLALGAFYFAFQIYGDFSGYSDIALGSARLLGFELLRNFNYPYFSRDIAEFWRRWHISLSSWFRDYLYFPLGGSRNGKWTSVRNTIIIFVVSGFWHGSNWTFIVWGALNAIYFLPLLLSDRNRMHIDIVAQGKVFPSLKEFFAIALTFTLTCIAWVFFRAESVTQAVHYLGGVFSPSLFTMPKYAGMVPAIGLQVLVEWRMRNHVHPLVFKNPFLRWAIYIAIALAIMVFVPKGESTFIYFQF
jgi:alginate O-acetyltransferase complex protein AlgI